MRATALALGAGVIAIAAPVSGKTSEQALDQGREITQLLFARDAATIASRLSPAFFAEIGGQDGGARFLAAVADQAGAEQEVLSEHAFYEARTTSYYRRSRFEKLPDVTTVWVIDDAGVILGGSVRPTQNPAPSSHLGYRTKARLRLPVSASPVGEWYVGWGGRDLTHNYHAVAPDQRFAYDLYIAHDDLPFRTDGKTNADYYCFGQPILAPGAGKVVAVRDGLPDNPPGVMDPANALGNHVVIDHGRGEFSFIAHLQQGSVTPRKGQRVRAGALLGRCGNSGNTTMPHLHYHLQTTAQFGAGEGLPAQFNGYRADGVPVERGEPLRGQTVQP